MHVVAQLIGYPRTGPNRELKRALERMWSGRLAADVFTERVDELRRAQVQGLAPVA
jgi:5-methyltetrahydropteroyltriglutamate--homocysteine methyltransferase